MDTMACYQLDGGTVGYSFVWKWLVDLVVRREDSPGQPPIFVIHILGELYLAIGMVHLLQADVMMLSSSGMGTL